ncbi:hypothetical protein JTB14_008387 [Gonioctena quinquepunctata]|nr:hypothetical protein JTB14_008387 [Gonioctena quinquepunctata]
METGSSLQETESPEHEAGNLEATRRPMNLQKDARVKLVEPLKRSQSPTKNLKGYDLRQKLPEKKAREAERGSSDSMPTKPTFSQVNGGEKEGILPKNYSVILLTMEEMESVKEIILDKIFESGKTRPKTFITTGLATDQARWS